MYKEDLALNNLQWLICQTKFVLFLSNLGTWNQYLRKEGVYILCCLSSRQVPKDV